MPRAPRIQFAGAIYHVMNRGDHLEAIFKDETDRKTWLRTLGETCSSAGWVVHGFVLMENHYHLLVETSRATLVKGMQYLNSAYTQRYNVRHELRGHLFQGRYKALLVDGEEKGYFLAVSDYIHLNPVRAGQVREAAKLWGDRWSSAGWLAGRRKGRPEWLRWERVYGELGLRNWGRRSRREYMEYLARRVEETLREGRRGAQQRWGKIRRGWCHGSEEFVARMRGRLDEMSGGERDEESWAGEAVAEKEEVLARRELAGGLRRLGKRKVGELARWEKQLMGHWLRRRTSVGVKWVARELKYGNVSGLRSGMSRVGRRLGEERRLNKGWGKLNGTSFSSKMP
ncbi:MAG: transposase [Verrucomicrobiae bacterium]|nr:transposase [Verrucomicrobiae bacterium]